jgi:hypothetical protein
MRRKSLEELVATLPHPTDGTFVGLLAATS